VVNTAVQIEITEALGGAIPQYAHHSLLIGADGKGLSKRLGSLSIGAMRETGYEAMAVVSHAALLGTSDNIHPCADYAELVAGFDFHKLSRAPSRFDEVELKHLNARLLHQLPWESVKDRLPGETEAFWLAIRGNIETLNDSMVWEKIVRNGVSFSGDPAEAPFLKEAASLLPPEPWDQTTWKNWTDAVKSASGRKGKSLFMPLRLAITGLDHGPELQALLPLIGRAKVLERLG
jgi:glutamyl-tRNA synthetase